MNIVKINKGLTEYIEKVKGIEVPDVYALYKRLGMEVIGRKVYTKPNKNKDYFNKSKEHKLLEGYIGKPNKRFYAQDIIKIHYEWRCLCINGNATSQQSMADKIIKEFGIKDFVFDMYSDIELKYLKPLLMEVNEIHLSTLSKEQLGFIYEQIL